MVDSCDYERLEEARIELSKVANNSETSSVPILIIANKQDMPGARSCSDIERSLSLQELMQSHPWAIVPAIALIGEGLHEALNSLYGLILAAKKSTKSKHKHQRIKSAS